MYLVYWTLVTMLTSQYLVGWNKEDQGSGATGLRTTVTDLIACLGPDVGTETVVDFSH